jgi:hypothetical protein
MYGYVARTGAVRNEYGVSRKPEGKTPLKGPRRKR